MNILLTFFIGIVLGAAIIGVLYFRFKSRHAEELQSYSTRAQILEAQCQAEKTRANEMIAQTEQTHAKVLAAQEARFQETLQRVTLELKSATDEMLKQRQQEFSQSSTQNLGTSAQALPSG